MLCVKAPVHLQGGIFQWRQGVLAEKRHPATLSLCFLSPCGSLLGVHSGQIGAGGARRNFQSDPGEWVTARVRGGSQRQHCAPVLGLQRCEAGEPAFGKARGPHAPPQASGLVRKAPQPLGAMSCSVASRLCALGPTCGLGLHLQKVSDSPL